MNNNPILIIDDDNDDLQFIQQAFAELKVKNEVLLFKDGDAFLHYMRTTDKGTFLVVCELNMHKKSGLELKRSIYEDERLRLKCIPFIFLAPDAPSDSVMNAYSYGVQGYFIKPDNFEALKALLQNIVSYWTDSQHPNM